MYKPLFLFLSCCVSTAIAATLSIGFVQSTGEFRLDGSAIRGNSTLFGGNSIETVATRPLLSLSGAQITLAPDSRAKIFHDHAILEKGTTVIRESDHFVLQAAGLSIIPAAKESVVQVDVSGATKISVATRVGSAEVRNATGIVVANLHQGSTLAFASQTDAPSNVTLSGEVVASKGKYFLTDTTTNVTVQLEGPTVSKWVGKDVLVKGAIVSGSQPAAGATQVIQVAVIESLAGTGAAAAAAHAGLSGMVKAAVIGGVSAGGAVVGLAAAGAFTTTTPVSR
jgi:uncharacterized protein YdeI (BOF family)